MGPLIYNATYIHIYIDFNIVALANFHCSPKFDHSSTNSNQNHKHNPNPNLLMYLMELDQEALVFDLALLAYYCSQQLDSCWNSMMKWNHVKNHL